MANSYGKKSFGQKFKSGILKLAFFGAAIGGPTYYHYGTIREVEGKIKTENYYDALQDDGKTYKGLIETDKGTFLNEKSIWFGKSDKDAEDIQSQTDQDETFRFKVYGAWPFKSNIIEAQQVTARELKEREAQKAAGNKGGEAVKPGEAAVQDGQPQNGATTAQPPAGLSGSMTPVNITFGLYTVKMTVPTEAVPHIKINSVEQAQTVNIVQQPQTPQAPAP